MGHETRADEAPRDPQGARLSPPPDPRRIHLRPLGRRQDHVSEVYPEGQNYLYEVARSGPSRSEEPLTYRVTNQVVP